MAFQKPPTAPFPSGSQSNLPRLERFTPEKNKRFLCYSNVPSKPLHPGLLTPAVEMRKAHLHHVCKENNAIVYSCNTSSSCHRHRTHITTKLPKRGSRYGAVQGSSITPVATKQNKQQIKCLESDGTHATSHSILEVMCL